MRCSALFLAAGLATGLAAMQAVTPSLAGAAENAAKKVSPDTKPLIDSPAAIDKVAPGSNSINGNAAGPASAVATPNPGHENGPNAAIAGHVDRQSGPASTRQPSPAHAERAGTTPAKGDPDRWRFRYFEGNWWYWLPAKRWVYWTNDHWQAAGTAPIEYQYEYDKAGRPVRYHVGYPLPQDSSAK